MSANEKFIFLAAFAFAWLLAGAQARPAIIVADPSAVAATVGPHVRIGVRENYRADFAAGQTFGFRVSFSADGGYADITPIHIGDWSTSLEYADPAGARFRFASAFGDAWTTLRLFADPMSASGPARRYARADSGGNGHPRDRKCLPE